MLFTDIIRAIEQRKLLANLEVKFGFWKIYEKGWDS